MPYSSKEGKDWIQTKIEKLLKSKKIKKTGNVLDIGAGSGTYQEFYSKILTGKWTGVEIWEPYIDRFDLKNKYVDVWVQDAKTIQWRNDDSLTNPYFVMDFDVIFLGDVLEHMTKGEAQKLVRFCYNNAKVVFVSIPIIHYPQGEFEGNPYEAHIKPDWTHEEVLESFDYIKEVNKGSEIGNYLITKNHE